MAKYVPSPRDWVREQVELYESSGGTKGTTLQDTGLPVIIVTHRGNKTGAIMGDEVSLTPGLEIKAETPIACIMKLFRNGEEVKRIEGRNLALEVKEEGVYRLEAWIETAGELRPWIYSNPIYVRGR